MTKVCVRGSMSGKIRVASITLVVAVAVLGMKVGAWLLTGSVALYSDALESTINVAAAVAALIALRVSGRPADANHPYGHDKAEYLSAVIESALVLTTSILIFREVWLGWARPHLPTLPLAGIALNAAAGFVNLIWARLLVRVGRRWRSPALTAGGRHVMTDVWTSTGVLVGFWLVAFSGYARLDPIVAALVGLNILRVGFLMLRQSVAGLMDEAMEPEALASIRRTIADNAGGAIEAHDLRTRQAGRLSFVEFHLVVPGDMTVDRSHEICDRLEGAIRAEAGDAMITIHVEPAGKAKHKGVVVL